MATMNRAIELAKEALARGDLPVGAVVVDKHGAIIGEGSNSKRCAHLHAELIAMEAACHTGIGRLDGATLYVTLEPCLMCLGAAMLQRLDTIVYAAPSPRYGAFSCGAVSAGKMPYMHHINIKIKKGVYAEESVVLLQTFFQSKRLKKRHKTANVAD